VVIDASVWVSRELPRDANHPTAVAWLNEHLPHAAVIAVPAIALAEVAGAIARRSGQAAEGRRALELIEAVPRLQVVAIDGPLGRQAAQVAADHRLRGADALYVAVAARLGVPLVTFDDELAARGAAIVEIIRP
jgi:predicted nucleic acid-binding protein